MLKTRLWMGAVLILLASLILQEDRWAAPWYPFLFLSYTAATVLGSLELLRMMRLETRPHVPLCIAAIFSICIVNWQPAIRASLGLGLIGLDPGHLVGGIVLGTMVLAFLLEMARFRGPGPHGERVGLTLLVVCYLGVLPCFLAQLRWLEPIPRATAALAMTVFVPKCGDIGAYFTGKFLTGRILGRTLMTPLLSPKKTWQGAAGGLIASVATAVVFESSFQILAGGKLAAIGFGLSVGIAGQLGDLAESLLKRDSQLKDASKTIPGFGGVLDVIDSLLFAAPVAYLWFAM